MFESHNHGESIKVFAESHSSCEIRDFGTIGIDGLITKASFDYPYAMPIIAFRKIETHTVIVDTSDYTYYPISHYNLNQYRLYNYHYPLSKLDELMAKEAIICYLESR